MRDNHVFKDTLEISTAVAGVCMVQQLQYIPQPPPLWCIAPPKVVKWDS